MEQDAASPRGLGGWLILLAANIVLLVVAASYLASLTIPLLRFELARAKTSGETLWPLVKYGPDLFIGVVMPLWVLFLFVRRSAAFPRTCVAFFVAWLLLALFDHAVTIISVSGVAPLSAWAPALPKIALGLALNVAYLAIWGTYLWRSVRVANTFVR